MKSGIDPPWRSRPRTSRPSLSRLLDAGRAQAFEIIEGDDVALGRQQHGDGVARHLPLVIAEERFGRAVEGEDAPGLVEHDHAVGRRIEDRLQLMDAAVLRRRRSVHAGRLADDHEVRRLAIPFGGRGAHGDGNVFVSPCGERESGILVARPAERRRAAEQMHETAIGPDLLDIVIAGQVEKEAVGEEDVLAAMDQDADRQPVEHPVAIGRGSWWQRRRWSRSRL